MKQSLKKLRKLKEPLTIYLLLLLTLPLTHSTETPPPKKEDPLPPPSVGISIKDANFDLSKWKSAICRMALFNTPSGWSSDIKTVGLVDHNYFLTQISRGNQTDDCRDEFSQNSGQEVIKTLDGKLHSYKVSGDCECWFYEKKGCEGVALFSAVNRDDSDLAGTGNHNKVKSVRCQHRPGVSAHLEMYTSTGFWVDSPLVGKKILNPVTEAGENACLAVSREILENDTMKLRSVRWRNAVCMFYPTDDCSGKHAVRRGLDNAMGDSEIHDVQLLLEKQYPQWPVGSNSTEDGKVPVIRSYSCAAVPLENLVRGNITNL